MCSVRACSLENRNLLTLDCKPESGKEWCFLDVAVASKSAVVNYHNGMPVISNSRCFLWCLVQSNEFSLILSSPVVFSLLKHSITFLLNIMTCSSPSHSIKKNLIAMFSKLLLLLDFYYTMKSFQCGLPWLHEWLVSFFFFCSITRALNQP